MSRGPTPRAVLPGPLRTDSGRQIDDHLERCAEALAAYEPGGEAADTPLYLVGQRGIVDALAAEAGLEPTATAAVDATGDPEPALEDAVHSFWTTELRVL